MATRDYYEILGVTRSASPDEIRRAHRKLARRFHPDVNKSPDASAKFAEVQEAYDVLSDEKRRKLYDQFGHAGVAPGGATPAGGAGAWPQSPGGFHVDVEDLGSMFDAFFGTGQVPGGFGARAERGPGAKPRGGARRHQPADIDLPVSFRTAALGGVERVHLSIDGVEKVVEVTIPPAVQDGARLRVRAVESREVVFVVRIGKHPLFRRGDGAGGGRDIDLTIDLPLTIAEATFGASVTIPTLDGSVELTVPPGTSGGRRLRVRGKGLRSARGEVGDLFVLARIVAPDPAMLNPGDRALLEGIARRSPNPRPGPEWAGRA